MGSNQGGRSNNDGGGGSGEHSRLLSQQHSHGSNSMDHSEHSSSHHRMLGDDVPVYSRPRQRQRWDDEQVLPHVNWGDLYIDLFYVAAAYNLATILKHSTNAIGLLYFVSCYFPSIMVWNEKMAYDARFAPEDNLFHRGLEVLNLVLLGLAVSHIRDVETMQDTTNNSVTLVFCWALLLETVVSWKKLHDVAANVDGGPEAIIHAQDDMKRKAWVILTLTVAVGIAMYDYFWLGVGGTMFGGVGGALAHEQEEAAPVNHLPIILCLASFVVEHGYMLLDAFVFPHGRIQSHKEIRVPMNLEFTLHRMGEWTMLMLGESVLSLLIVDISSGLRYFITLVSGIVSVTMMQYLYFRSQPSEPKHHAMRLDRVRAFVFYYSFMVYSASLIIVGASYKMTLTLYYEDEEKHGNEEQNESSDEGDGGGVTRFLHGAGGSVFMYGPHEMKTRIAFFYGVALTVSLFTLDLMIMAHYGIIRALSRMWTITTNPRTGKRVCRPAWPQICIMTTNYTMMAIAATMGIWGASDAIFELLPIVGMLIVIGQVLLRTQGFKLWGIYKDDAISSAAWPNVTEAQSRPSKILTHSVPDDLNNNVKNNDTDA